MTDNGAAYTSRRWRATCRELGFEHLRARPCTPRTNGKAERLIGTMLRSWTRAFIYRSSPTAPRRSPAWLRWYNRRRPHASLGGLPPASRVPHLRGLYTLEGWGDNALGQADEPLGRYQQVGAGLVHACAVKESGELACRGYNEDGQADAPSGWYRQVIAGSFHTCAAAESGELTCRGASWYSQEDVLASYDPDATQIPISTSGRIEFAFTPAGGERILPPSRYFPSDATPGRWLRSTLIEPGG